jgi:ADP-heptose:LPS heptosyltransferase
MEAAPDYGGPPPERIAVLRALQLGDMLCAVPALRALRRAFPNAHVTLVGLPWARDFVQRFGHLVDELLEFPGYPGLPERTVDLAGLPGFFAEAQAARFDVALQLHGNGVITNPVLIGMGARLNGGFYAAGQYCPDPHRFVQWPEQGHEIERCLALIEYLGVPTDGTGLEFPLLKEDLVGAAALLAEHGLRPGEYAVVHPGARMPSRRWPAESFGAVAARLAQLDLRVVLTGTAEERDLTRAVARAAGCGVVDLAGATSLGTAAALIGGARLLVCNDTGVSHVAAALGAPSVVVCSGADPYRWAPLDAARHRLVFHPTDCRPCGHHECPLPDHPCATGVSVTAVVDAMLAMLDTRSFAAPQPRMRARTYGTAPRRVWH